MQQPIHQLYKKFTEYYPGYVFGYADKSLYYSISVMERGSALAKRTQVGLVDSEDSIKRSWYALLKELNPNVAPHKASE